MAKILIFAYLICFGAGADIERSCSDSVNAKVSYFVPQRTFQTECFLTVNLYSSNVHQIRLDFERFSIAQPTSVNQLATNNSYQCNDDSFTINAANTNLGFVSLCGENTGQHIYVTVTEAQSISLNFQFAGDRDVTNIQPQIPDWRIRIAQLELIADAALIAPVGCLQYYPEKAGVYETFNFNNGLGPYIGRTYYAICFQRAPNSCQIKHTPHSFSMNWNIDEVDLIVTCRPDATNSDRVFNSDYLFVPDGIYNGTSSREFYCGNGIDSTLPVTSSIPGPLYVIVKTDDLASVDRPEFAFRIEYEIRNTGCGII